MTESGPAEGARKWLLREGFPLEMRTARAFRRHPGLSVTPSAYYYVDGERERTREIDVKVGRSIAFDSNLVMTVEALVECKTIPANQQAIAFRSRTTWMDFHIFRERAATRAGRTWLDKIWVSTQMDDGEPVPLLCGRQPQAYGLTTSWQSGERDNRDIAYQAMAGAATAANAVVQAWDGPEGAGIVGFTFPLVVLNGALVIADLAPDSDDVEVEQVDRVQMLWNNPLTGSTTHVVDVITESALEQWTVDFVQMAARIVEADGHADLAREAWRDTHAEPTIRRLR